MAAKWFCFSADIYNVFFHSCFLFESNKIFNVNYLLFIYSQGYIPFGIPLFQAAILHCILYFTYFDRIISYYVSFVVTIHFENVRITILYTFESVSTEQKSNLQDITLLYYSTRRYHVSSCHRSMVVIMIVVTSNILVFDHLSR